METATNKIGKIITTIIVILLLLIGIIGYIGWYNLLREVPSYYESPEEHFKYGSIGTERVEGVPYLIWEVLPRLFPEKLPGKGGYVSLGISWEEGKEMPIGFPKKTIGFPRVGLNCASCHTASFRKKPQDKPTFVPAGPSTRFNSQAYIRFFLDCAHDPRFTSDYILPAIEYNHHLSWLEKNLYRFLIIPTTKKTILDQESTYTWMNIRPDWGPGRIDLNPLKLRVLKLKDDNSIGSTDVMAIWNEKDHEGLLHHSDGLNTTLVESVLSGALATGTNKKEIDLASLERVQNWLLEVQPPSYPFEIDSTQLDKGKKLFDNQCSSCHAFGGKKTGQVIPLSEVKTDPNRTNHWTQEASDGFNEFAEDYSWDFDHFQTSNGYLSLPLEGLWLRAPYLHNGSVPYLTDLLETPENRTDVFYRGYDVYNPEKVGFVAEGPQAEKAGFKYDVKVLGNSNQGHLFGTDLPEKDKQALIEYLKTL